MKYPTAMYIVDTIISSIIMIFGIPIVLAIALFFAMRSMNKQREEMLYENEEYYQKMNGILLNHLKKTSLFG